MLDYKHILVGIDFSQGSKTAVKRANEIAAVCGADLTLLHVVDYTPPAYVSVALPAVFSTPGALSENASNHLMEWASSLDLEKYTPLVKAGSAKRLLIETANEIQADLVVLAPHDSSGLVRTFGSVSNAVVQSLDCDTLIIRS